MRHSRPPKEIPPPLELECLKALWELGEANVHAVQDSLNPKKKLAYTTVMTLLERLARKGCVSRRKVGRAFIYSPVAGREALRRAAIRDLLDSLFESSPNLLLAYLKNGASREPAPEGNERLDDALL
ncbi:MAG: BlaI/MecI/CopY family transcriptional regulator [Candidatus Solibacter usitatus]|nr:BlaI/MecI/CopY family transcriptional regulator [Candidatus Solibacter usitatus]